MEKAQYNNFHRNAKKQPRVIDEKNFTYRILLEIIKPYLRELKEKQRDDVSILDIGCGVGTLDFFLGKQGLNVLGIDISNQAVSSATSTAKFLNLEDKVKFKTADFLREPIINKKFDFVLCNEVLEHLEDDTMALLKISRVMKSKGILYVSVPSKNAPLYRIGFTKQFDKKVGHLRRYEINDLKKIITRDGLIILKEGRTEGIFRNFLFISSKANKFVRFLKFFISDAATWMDNLTLGLFGESNIFLVAQKP